MLHYCHHATPITSQGYGDTTDRIEQEEVVVVVVVVAENVNINDDLQPENQLKQWAVSCAGRGLRHGWM